MINTALVQMLGCNYFQRVHLSLLEKYTVTERCCAHADFCQPDEILFLSDLTFS